MASVSKKVYQHLYPNIFDKNYDYYDHFVTTLDGRKSKLHQLILNERTYALWTELQSGRHDVDVFNKNFETPLLGAARIQNKKKAIEMIKFLLESNADINRRDHEGNTPLHVIVQNEITPETLEIFEFFLNHTKTKINIKNTLGETALHVVTDKIMAEKLISSGAHVNSLDNGQNTPLHKQVTRPEICRVLIENGAEIDAKNNNDMTALHEAIVGRCEESFEVLLQAGADVNVKISHKYTAVDLAYEFRTDRVIQKKILEICKPVYLLYAAAYDETIVEEVLNKWGELYENKKEIFKIILNLINMLRFRKTNKRVNCVHVIAQFFFRNIDNLRNDHCIKILQKFSQVLEMTLLSFMLKTYDYFNKQESYKEIEKIVNVLLDRGEKVDYTDLVVVYIQFGDSVLLHKLSKFKPVTRRLNHSPLLPKILCDPTINLTELLKQKTLSTIEVQDFFDVHNVARYCSLPPNLWKEFQHAYTNIYRDVSPVVFKNGMEECLRQIGKNCGVVTLKEMARNVTRTALCHIFKKTKTDEIYEILEKLKIPPPIVSIIMLERPLHLNVKLPDYWPYVKHVFLLSKYVL